MIILEISFLICGLRNQFPKEIYQSSLCLKDFYAPASEPAKDGILSAVTPKLFISRSSLSLTTTGATMVGLLCFAVMLFQCGTRRIQRPALIRRKPLRFAASFKKACWFTSMRLVIKSAYKLYSGRREYGMELKKGGLNAKTPMNLTIRRNPQRNAAFRCLPRPRHYHRPRPRLLII